MKQLTTGICFYPTKVGLIDDNAEYLESLAWYFKTKGVNCLSFTNPQKALDFLTNQYKADSFVNRCIQNKESNHFDHLLSVLNIPVVREEIYNPNRFNEMSILVIDYAMPEMNGLELCRQLRKLPIKIIMLTGEANKEFAVEVFNEGSIDKFILKSTSNLQDSLFQMISDLQIEYFLDLSKIALNKITDFSKNILTCLDDAVFIAFFKNLCAENKISEYYLLDVQGSFLLLDTNGKPYILAVANEEMMETYYQLATDDSAPDQVIEPLKSKRMLPYFHSPSDFSIRPAEWERYLHPLENVQGKETYYCAYIKDVDQYQLNVDKICSYKNFLEKNATNK